MTPRRPMLRYLLLLMFAAGPLQAQTVLLCDMMDVPRQETCCCGDAEAARESDPGRACEQPQCHVAPRAEAGGCCDSTVEVSYEPEAGQTVDKSSDHRSSFSPPAPVFLAYELPEPPQTSSWPTVPPPVSVAASDGSSLYLRTERLRI